MTYSQQEKTRAIAWKTSTDALPAAAKVAAPYVNKDGKAAGPAYDFCLPAELADHNLLPDVREQALALFAELGIPWHASVAGRPEQPPAVVAGAVRQRHDQDGRRAGPDRAGLRRAAGHR